MIHPLVLTLILATAPTDAGLANPSRDPFAGPGQAREAPCEPPSLLCTSWQRVRVTGVVSAVPNSLKPDESICWIDVEQIERP